ncbi:MAG: (2Fe-2S)-binding protein [Alphaproteobacteria bacterium]
MRICICNGIKEEAIQAALERGASKVSEIYRDNKCAPTCGQCVPKVRQILSKYSSLQLRSD